MWESTRIQTALLADSSVTSLLSTFVDSNTVTQYAIFNDGVMPKWATELSLPNTINYYRIGSVDGGLEYGDVRYSISCRGDELQDAEDIQYAVYTALNRHLSSLTGFFICTALPTISPKDSTDNYNAPIEVRIKTK